MDPKKSGKEAIRETPKTQENRRVLGGSACLEKKREWVEARCIPSESVVVPSQN